MSILYSLRYRDGIGRWNMGFVRASDIGNAMTLARMRYGAYLDLHTA